ncbi:MAG TPA: mechanosensitive ion channel family protein [Steroidobacteraceae bacterium]|nr:mechanosensitive ion channel family protein [Steroidobacteraceae bacterium]
MDDTPLETLVNSSDALTRLAAEYGPNLLSATLVLVAGFFVTRGVGRVTARWLDRFRLEPPVRSLLLRAVRLLVFLLFVLIALQNLGIDLLPLIAGLGIAGAGIALALQGVLGNAAAGLTIIFTKPFRVGEYISIAGEEGVVHDISLFSTVLRHADLSIVVIPNRKIVGEILHNYGEIRQLQLNVGVAYGTNLETAVAAVREVLEANPRVLKDPAPLVQAAALGDFSINIAIKPWVAVKDFGRAPGEINPDVLRVFAERGIEIPLPTVRQIRTLAHAG